MWQVGAVAFREWGQPSPTGLLPTPGDSLATLFELVQSGSIFPDVASSLKRILFGYAAGVTLALALATISLFSRFFRVFFRQIVEILRPIPPIAFVPLAILWFGLGDPSAYFLVAFAAFFPAFTATLAAFDGVDRRYVDSARTLGAGRMELFRSVYWPAALPGIVAGLRTSLGIAWFVVIVAEMVGAQSGLGYFIQINRLTLNSKNVLAGMLAIGLIGFTMNWLFWKGVSPFVAWAGSSDD